MARKRSVGLDIGTRSINVAEVSMERGRPTVTDFGRLEIRSGAVRDGEIMDPEDVSAAIRDLMGSTGIKDKQVLLGIANQRVVVRQVELPYLPEEELRESLRYQVQEHIPFPVEDAELDFHVLEELTNDEDTPMMRLLLVAANKDMVANQIRAVQDAGLRPTGVDLNPFALLRAVGERSALDGGSEVLLDIGAGVTNIVVHDQGTPRFVRILALGGDDITEALQSDAGLSFEDAEAIKQSVGLEGGDDPDSDRIIRERASQFVDEIRSSLDYYRAQASSPRISRVAVSGGGAFLPGLTDELGSTLRVPVELTRPFDRVQVGKTAFTDEQLAAVGPLLATAIGLGLGGLS